MIATSNQICEHRKINTSDTFIKHVKTRQIDFIEHGSKWDIENKIKNGNICKHLGLF